MQSFSPCLFKYNRSQCCRAIGKTGFDSLDAWRWEIFLSIAALLVTSVVLTCISAVGISLDSTNDYPWYKASRTRTFESGAIKGHFEFYAGLSGEITEWRTTNMSSGNALRNEYVKAPWDGSSCSSTACEECRSASTTSIVLVFLVLIFALPTLVAVRSRMISDTDGHVEKLTGVVGSALGFLCSLAAVLIYSFQCAQNLSTRSEVLVDHHQVMVGYNWTIGIGSICLIVSVVFNFLSAVGHVCVISPDPPPELEQLLPDKDTEAGEKEQLSAEEQERQEKAQKKEELERSLAAARAAAAEADRVKEEAAQLAKEAMAEADGGYPENESELLYPDAWQSLPNNDAHSVSSNDVVVAQAVAEAAAEGASERMLPAA